MSTLFPLALSVALLSLFLNWKYLIPTKNDVLSFLLFLLKPFCISCFLLCWCKAYFYIKDSIKSLREKYLLRFGLVPKFSASFHSGKVIVGEIGELKSQIVYHGEMLYQLAAIEKYHGKLDLDENILISDSLVRQLSISSLYQLKEVGALPLDDGSSMSLYSLSIGSDIEL